MTTKYFKQQVKRELRALKKLAFKRELEKLNFDGFLPTKTENCIYGQMTEDCRSKRAMYLINKICPLKVVQNPEHPVNRNISSLGVIKDKLDGSKGFVGYRLSFLEAHIMRFPKFNEAIISWLKSETTKFPITINN